MEQNKSQSGAADSSDSTLLEFTPAPHVSIELLRRPTEQGVFGTISFKVAVSNAAPADALRLLGEMTQAMENSYGNAINL